MTKSNASDLSPDAFAKWLKRAGFSHIKRISGDFFEDTKSGVQFPGLYAGRMGRIQFKATTKYLLAQRTAFGARPSKAPKPERKPRVRTIINTSHGQTETVTELLPL